MSKVKRFSILFLVVLTISCALLGGCGGKNKYLNGHHWGETENQTAGKGWERAKFAGYKVEKVWTYHSDGLYEVQYTFVVIDKDAEDVFRQLKRTLGRPDYSEKNVVLDPVYTWYEGSVSIEAHLTEYKADYANAHGERTVKVVVTIVNDKYH